MTKIEWRYAGRAYNIYTVGAAPQQLSGQSPGGTAAAAASAPKKAFHYSDTVLKSLEGSGHIVWFEYYGKTMLFIATDAVSQIPSASAEGFLKTMQTRFNLRGIHKSEETKFHNELLAARAFLENKLKQLGILEPRAAGAILGPSPLPVLNNALPQISPFAPTDGFGPSPSEPTPMQTTATPKVAFSPVHFQQQQQGMLPPEPQQQQQPQMFSPVPLPITPQLQVVPPQMTNQLPVPMQIGMQQSLQFPPPTQQPKSPVLQQQQRFQIPQIPLQPPILPQPQQLPQQQQEWFLPPPGVTSSTASGGAIPLQVSASQDEMKGIVGMATDPLPQTMFHISDSDMVAIDEASTVRLPSASTLISAVSARDQQYFTSGFTQQTQQQQPPIDPASLLEVPNPQLLLPDLLQGGIRNSWQGMMTSASDPNAFF